jgi:hypothetical protein
MPSLHEYDAWSKAEDPFARRPHVIKRADCHFCKDFRFGDVRSHDMGNRKEFRLHCGHSILVEQSIASFRDHDRIDDHVRQIERAHSRHDRFDNRGVRQHPNLDCVSAEIADDRLDLRGDEIGGQRLPRFNATRVLRRDGCDRGCAEHAMRSERLEVCLDSRTATGIAPGYRQGCLHG